MGGIAVAVAAVLAILVLFGALSTDDGGFWATLLALFGGAVLFGAWRHANRTVDELAGREDEIRAQGERERELRERVHRLREAERRWSHELRERVAEHQHRNGALGAGDDLCELVLRTAMSLVEADKGLLLSRTDGDDDGDLDLAAHRGFEHDPAHSGIAQRFAEEVIERDTVVREDDRPTLDESRRGAADEEIRNLIAVPIYIRDRFHGVVVCANRDGGFEEYDDEVLLSLGDQAGAVLTNGRLRGQLRSAYLATVHVLAEAIEAKDRFVREHSEEVADYVAAVADRLGVEGEKRELLIFGSLLHDIGKIGISERILLKPGPLTHEERSVVELHPRIGHRLIEQVPALRPIAQAVLHHHERFDGEGYPSRLRGEDIPLEARIVCVADCFSAMTADRPYREGMPIAAACEELERCAGTQFDPQVVKAFVEAVRRHQDEPSDGEVPVHALAAAFQDPEVATQRDGETASLGHRARIVTDGLTLLYSRRFLHECADMEVRRAEVQGRPFAVALVEVADLTRRNREDGWAAGDEALRCAAAALDRAAARSGGTACRYGGSRLALLVPGLDEAGAQGLCRQVAAELDGGPTLHVSAAEWQAGESGEQVISRARAGLPAAAAGAV